jgi:hypothetical protein
VTSQEPRTPHSVDHDIPDTEVIVVSSPAPVFVDSTGRRRRLLRRLSYAFGALCMVYGGLVSVSLAGGPVSSEAVLPLPDLRNDDAEDAAGPRPAPIPTPAASTRPPDLFVSEALPRRAAPADLTRIAEPRPPAVPTPTPVPAKTPASTSPTTAKPVESTTNPGTPAPTTPVPSPTTLLPEPPINVPPAPPAPPVPPVPSAPPSSGGTAGGGRVPEDDDDTVAADESTPQATAPASAPEPSVAAEGTA